MALSPEEINILFMLWLYRQTDKVGLLTAKTLDRAIKKALAVVSEGPLSAGPKVSAIFRQAEVQTLNVFTGLVLEDTPKTVAFADREVMAVKGASGAGLAVVDLADDAAVQRVIRNTAAMGGLELTITAQNPINSLERQIARGFILPDGSLLTDSLTTPAANTERLFQRRIRQAIITEQLTLDLVGTLETEATRQVRALETEARTGAQSLANSTSMSRFRQAGITHVLFVAIMDSRTSEQCKALNGKIFPIEEAPEPPLHRNCRSQLAAMAGAAVGTTGPRATPLDWLANQPAETQNRILSNEGAEVFKRTGRLV